MIVFLTLGYCAVLFVLIKTKVVPANLYTYLSPVAWFLLLFVGLFIPMQFWAPQGNVIISQPITRMSPRVGGRVIKVHVRPNERVKKGAALVTIDPRPYQDDVNALRASLAAAKQGVLELKANLDAATSKVAEAKAKREAAKATLEAATAGVAQARAQRDTLASSLQAAAATVVQAKAKRDLSRNSFEIAEAVRGEDAGALSKLKFIQAKETLAEADAAVKVATANEAVVRTNYDKSAPAAIEIALADERKARVAYEGEAVAAINRAVAEQTKARLAYTSQIGGVNTTVAEVAAKLAKAEYDLAQTTVYAPADGYVTDLQLTEGSAISVTAGGAMINFIAENETDFVIASIEAKNLRFIEPGQEAEVVLPLYPGVTFTGKVHEVVWVTGEGQVMPQEPIPAVASRVKTGGHFAVKIVLDAQWSAYRRPIGAGGIAAVYTAYGKPTHVIRKVMVRMTSWTNYVFQMPGQ